MPLEVQDVIRAVVRGNESGIGTTWQNVFHWRVTDLQSDEPAAVTDDISFKIVEIYDHLAPSFTPNAEIDDIDVLNATKKERLGTAQSAWVGTHINETADPGQIACQVLARSRTLGHVARKYFGPLAEGVFVDGRLDAARVGDFTNALSSWDTAFVGGVAGNTYVPCTVSYDQGGFVAFSRVLEDGFGSVENTARTMRRRIPGRGS